jgi:hypothetical protein
MLMSMRIATRHWFAAQAAKFADARFINGATRRSTPHSALLDLIPSALNVGEWMEKQSFYAAT